MARVQPTEPAIPSREEFHMRRQLFTLALLVTRWLTTAAAHADEKVAFPAGSTLHADLVYSKPSANTSLHLDLARPRGEGPFPVVMFIHGGGWVMGSRKTYHSYMAPVVEAGYVAVSVEYRLAPDHPFPAALHDVKCAVRWLRANAARYGIDAGRIGVVGYSAGGQLACLLGTTADNAKLEGTGGCPEQSSRVQAVTAYYALTDLTAMHRACETQQIPYFERTRMLYALQSYCKAPLKKAQDTYTLASPVTHVHRNAAPTLLIHGTHDELVPVKLSRMYNEALKRAGAEVSLLEVPGAGHNFVGAHEKAPTEAMMQFFERQLK
jgi:acetyl esterase/lipase